jgi:hypothetical protein
MERKLPAEFVPGALRGSWPQSVTPVAAWKTSIGPFLRKKEQSFRIPTERFGLTTRSNKVYKIQPAISKRLP